MKPLLFDGYLNDSPKNDFMYSENFRLQVTKNKINKQTKNAWHSAPLNSRQYKAFVIKYIYNVKIKNFHTIPVKKRETYHKKQLFPKQYRQ